MPCASCRMDVHAMNEYAYMIKDDLWRSVSGGDGFLCVECLEVLLGRQLAEEDFFCCPLTTHGHLKRSGRLLDRLGRLVKKK